MRPEDFEFLSSLVKRESGLVLSEDKSYLLESRLMPLARKRNLNGLEELVDQARKGIDATLTKDITEAMTTNESFFFRDINRLIFSEMPHCRSTLIAENRKNHSKFGVQLRQVVRNLIP